MNIYIVAGAYKRQTLSRYVLQNGYWLHNRQTVKRLQTIPHTAKVLNKKIKSNIKQKTKPLQNLLQQFQVDQAREIL